MQEELAAEQIAVGGAPRICQSVSKMRKGHRSANAHLERAARNQRAALALLPGDQQTSLRYSTTAHSFLQYVSGLMHAVFSEALEQNGALRYFQGESISLILYPSSLTPQSR